MKDLTSDDAYLDRLWRARYGEPLPVRGCADLVRRLHPELFEDADSSAPLADPVQ